jgi:putative peptide maturation dehydrogenase
LPSRRGTSGPGSGWRWRSCPARGTKTRIRRTRYLFLYCDDEPVLDVGELLRGTARIGYSTSIRAISILKGEHYPLTLEQLTFLLSVPSREWIEVDGDGAMATRLAERGLVVSDGRNSELAELRRRDAELAAGEWNVYAALFHFMTRWQGVDVRAHLGTDGTPVEEVPPLTREEIERFVTHHGRPPEPFHSAPNPLGVRELPLIQRDDGLYGVLSRRRTSRSFDPNTPMTAEELAVVLYYVWGCHGYVPMLPGMLALKRTSPSGGGLHPVEAYPIVTNVDGVSPGLYHYNGRDHTLELLAGLEAAEAHELATEFTAGQSFFGAAHVAVVMTARFYRSFWKYRRHQKAYPALLMDVAHLSQTLYLVSAELGLGAFVTAAINACDIEDRLGLDGFREGALAIAGCGKRVGRLSSHEPRFSTYVPRETTLSGAPGAPRGRDGVPGRKIPASTRLGPSGWASSDT